MTRQPQKVVRLSEIKTKTKNRTRQALIEDMRLFPTMVNQQQVNAYVVVMWREDGSAIAYWDTQALGPLGTLRSTLVKDILDKIDITQHIGSMLDEAEE
jgi:UV DNA damage repair endonuclease